MAKYLVQGNYGSDGVKALRKEGGTSRRDAIDTLMKSLGGSLESLYYALGGADVIAVVDLPDNASATAASLIVNASGAVTVTVTVLLTVEEMDVAARLTPNYRTPGR